MAQASDWNDEPTETFERRVHTVLGNRLDFPVLLRRTASDELWAGWYWARGTEAIFKVFTCDSERGAERVLNEARLFASVEHPALVQILDGGRADDGRPFVAMEHLHGETLEELLERDGPLGAADALRLLVPVVDGLVALHEAGLVHRDLRPGTIHLTHLASGRLQPKLFGFAMGARREVPRDRAPFQAPELLVGAPHSAASDVYSLATVALACVERGPRSSRRRPLPAGGPVQAPEPGALEQLNALLEPFLRTEAADRRSNARELRSALARHLLDLGASEDASGRPLAPSRR